MQTPEIIMKLNMRFIFISLLLLCSARIASGQTPLLPIELTASIVNGGPEGAVLRLNVRNVSPVPILLAKFDDSSVKWSIWFFEDKGATFTLRQQKSVPIEYSSARTPRYILNEINRIASDLSLFVLVKPNESTDYNFNLGKALSSAGSDAPSGQIIVQAVLDHLIAGQHEAKDNELVRLFETRFYSKKCTYKGNAWILLGK